MEHAAMDAADNGTASDAADTSRGSTKENMGHGRVVKNDPADFRSNRLRTARSSLSSAES